MSYKREQGKSALGTVCCLLGVIFITLKIVRVEPIYSWSWWQVTAPLWGGALAWFLLAFVVLTLGAMEKVRKEEAERKEGPK